MEGADLAVNLSPAATQIQIISSNAECGVKSAAHGEADVACLKRQIESGASISPEAFFGFVGFVELGLDDQYGGDRSSAFVLSCYTVGGAELVPRWR